MYSKAKAPVSERSPASRAQAPARFDRIGSSGRHDDLVESLGRRVNACDDFWEICDEAIDSGDYKLHSKDATWRTRALAKHDKIFEVVKHCM